MPTWLLDWKVWGLAGIGALALALFVQTVRLNGCQDSLRAAGAQTAVLSDKLKTQNEAVDTLKEEADKKALEASQALAAARRDSLEAKAQVDALKAALAASKGQKPSACPAGDAVKEVRRAITAR